MQKDGIKIAEMVRILEGEVLCCHDKLERPVHDVAASDLLSDVLGFERENYALLTGLTNAQIVRTAEITNAVCVVILRNKQPQPAAVALAKRTGIPLVLSRFGMFEACCRLAILLEEPHGAGIEGTSDTSGT
jgi:predicted transcriptional regulator